MNTQSTDQSADQLALFDKIRQQFDSAPYPNTPLETSPKEFYSLLALHNLVIPYYLRDQRITSTEGKTILDAGCGTGYNSLVLAEANPGAKIVGIDLSSASVKLAKQRLQFYGFDNTEFIAASIEDLPRLGFEFDYINCDEVLYLLPDIAQGLQTMKAVLKPKGIIRANLHSAMQRFSYFRAQQMFQLMGLMNENPDDLEIEISQETFLALHDWVELKARVWQHRDTKKQNDKQFILMNYLFQGDKGYTIADLFTALRSADLEFINMTNWTNWNLLDLFQDPDDLPTFWAMSLPEVSIEQQLQLFELLQPEHRLLDFWCGHPNQAHPFTPVSEWSDADWQQARVTLHPQLTAPKIRTDLVRSIENEESFEVSRYLAPQARQPSLLKGATAACLLPLWDGSQPVAVLVDRFVQTNPVDFVTLEPIDRQIVFEEVKELLIQLESFAYVLLERSTSS